MGMPKGWRKLRLATGPYRWNGNNVAQTFDEFLEDQRIRVQNKLRAPIDEDYDGRFSLEGEHPRARANDHLTRSTLQRDAVVEVRGRI